MNDNLHARLAKLEVIARRDRTCPVCFDWPSRRVGIDEDTGEILGENMPETGCPECGRPVRHTRPYIGINPVEV